VTYNGDRDEYLVVWSGDDLQFRLVPRSPTIVPVLVDNEFEIFGQRLTANGTEVGANDIRISDAGPPIDADFDAFAPDIAYNALSGRYLAVWFAREPFANATDTQVYGQGLSATGVAVGTNDFRISEAARDGQGEPRAVGPEVAASTRAEEFLIVWTDGSNVAQLFGERRDGSGQRLGPSDVSLATKPPDDTSGPSDVAYSGLNSRYIATWTYADMGAINSDVIDRRLVAGAAPILPPPTSITPRPRIFCGGRTATIVGTNRSEVIRGTARADVIVARRGNDTVIGGRGNDTICLGPGNDRGLAGKGTDRVFGQAGRDRLTGGRGADRLIGGAGIDTIVGQQGRDRILAGPGADRITGGSERDVILAGSGNDRVRGGAGNDRILGQGGRDTLRGQAGRDVLLGGSGRDVAIGGPGNDRCVAEVERSC
jgi:Ca2+-binding RTX toxin-like protein